MKDLERQGESVNTKYLELHKPSVKVEFSWNLQEAINNLLDKGFVCSLVDEKRAIIHGESWINDNDKVVLHLYFDESDNDLESIMIHSKSITSTDTIVDSYKRKEIWLTECYGAPQQNIKNTDYDIYDTKRINEYCEIDHFIKDRYGDEEGIYIKTIKK